MAWPRTRYALTRGAAPVGAVLLVLILATLSASLIGGKVFSSGDNILLWPPFSSEQPAGWVGPSNSNLTDPVAGFVPDLLQTRADLRNGVLPVWNPYAAAGRPLFASIVHAPLFPLTWLALLLPFWSSFAWLAAAKLLLAALGAYLFCRELALRRGPSLLGGIAFAFGSYFFVWLEHPQTNVWAMLPWAFLATRRVCARGSLGATALLGACIGLACLGGHPESAAFVLAATVAYGIFELLAEHFRGPPAGADHSRWSGPEFTRSIGGRCALLAGGIACGVGIGAVVGVPLLELLGQSGKTERGGPAAPFKMAWSFFFPELWGNPSKAFAAGPANYEERTAFFGVLPLLFAVGTLGRRRPREQWFFIGLVIVLVATIYDTPLWASGIRDLPGGKVAALGRLVIVVSFAGAVLAAYGLQRWLEASAQERRTMLRIMGVAAVLPLLAWLPRHLGLLSSFGDAVGQLPTIHHNETSPTVISLASVWRWALLSAIGLGGLALTSRRRSASAIAFVVLLTGIDLVTLDRGFHGSIPLREANPPVPGTIAYLQRHQGDGRITGSGIAMPANLAERYDLRDMRVAIDVPYPLRYSQLWSGLGGVTGDQEVFSADSPHAQQLANLFDVRYVLLAPGSPVPGWLRPVYRDSGGIVAFNATALPRAWVAYDWRSESGRAGALAETLRSTTTAAREQPVLEGAPAPPQPQHAPATTSAKVVVDGANKVTVEATVMRPGYLVLDDSAYPGWKASVDGRSAPWLPADENFRAVRIPAGRHLVSFVYRPASVVAGAVVALLSVLALLALALLGVVWSRRSPSSNAGGSSSGQRSKPAWWARKRSKTASVLSP
jgi:hypothetical protein